MKTLFNLLVMTALTGIVSVAANASSFNFFSNSAMSFFTKEDWKISKTAEVKALDHLQDGVKLAWTNPNTGSHGIFVPRHTSRANGSLCRELSIVHTANLVNEKAIYRFCKLKDQWKIV